MSDYQSYLDFALELVYAAEAEILPRFQNCSVSSKEDGSEVTDADREAERLMRDAIEKKYPDHGILGEEFGLKESDLSFQWVLDPVDGTTSFVLGVSDFGTLVALTENKEPVVGVIHLPGVGETVYAAKGLGCWYRQKGTDPVSVKITKKDSPGDAIVAATDVNGSDLKPDNGNRSCSFQNVIPKVKKFRFIGDCLKHALVCRGKIQVAFDPVMCPWDIAALVPCIEEAGGKVTSLEGKRENIIDAGNLLASCGGELHDQMVELLKPA